MQVLSRICFCFFLLLLGLFIGCKPISKGNSSQSKQKEPDEILLVYISQSPCMGKCPDYEAWFYSGRKMIYEGRSHMPVLGKYEYFIPAELTKNLIFEAVKQNLKLVPDSMPTPPDVSVVKIMVNMNGKVKKITGWTGFGNENFNSYVKLVHGEVKAMIQDQEGLKRP